MDGGHFYYSNIDLTSEPDRLKHAGIAKERWPGFPWREIFDSVSIRTLKSYREGNPWVCLADMAAPSDTVPYLVPPMLEEDAATLIFADGGSGKSYLAAVFSLLVGTDFPIGGLKSNAAPANVTYLDWESSEDAFWRRINALTAGLGIAIPETLFYRRMAGKLTNMTSELQGYITANKVGLVIVDSAALACGDSEGSGEATILFDALRELKTTALVLAHTTKTDQTRPFGSVFMRNGPRSVWQLSRDDDANEQLLTIAARNTKTNNGPTPAPMGWQFNFEDDGRIITVTQTDANLLDQVADTQPVRIRISELLGESGSMWTTAIAEELQVDAKTVARTLKRGEGHYFKCLTTQGRAKLWGLLSP